MEYPNLIIDKIQEAFFDRHDEEQKRTIRLYTGAGGADLFGETMEFKVSGTVRVYMGYKVLRILRRLKTPIHKSYSGRYYKCIKP